MFSNTSKFIDLNADLGEEMPNDEALFHVITSANIACGGHVGDDASMRRALRFAKVAGVAVGAHPSFPDKENFGRHAMVISSSDLEKSLIFQIRALISCAFEVGVDVRYVKAHGALYNLAATQRGMADCLLGAVKAVNPNLSVVVLSGSPIVDWAKGLGFHVIEEVFADRRYQSDGTLAPRSEEGSVLDNEKALAQAVSLVTEGGVRLQDGQFLPLKADSLCVHGDNAHALSLAREIRQSLEHAGVSLRSFV
jgi:UPF0271 protein